MPELLFILESMELEKLGQGFNLQALISSMLKV